MENGDVTNADVTSITHRCARQSLDLFDDSDGAAGFPDRADAGCLTHELSEIHSLGATLPSWRIEILARQSTALRTVRPRVCVFV